MAKETVIIVHGTFAGPREGQTQWYEPGSETCQKIDAALDRHGSSARTWAHGPDPELCAKLNLAFATPDESSDRGLMESLLSSLRTTGQPDDEEDDGPIRRWKEDDQLSFFWDGGNNWRSRQVANQAMPRQPKPFFRKQTKSWYFSTFGRQLNLGKDRDAAFAKFHEMMLEPDTHASNAQTLYEISQSYLDWVETEAQDLRPLQVLSRKLHRSRRSADESRNSQAAPSEQMGRQGLVELNDSK